MTTPETPGANIPSPATHPGRMNRFAGVALRWAAGAGAIFTLGIIATWIVQVGPRTREITRLQSQLEVANRDLAAAQSEVQRLGPIEDEFARSDQRRLTLQALVDVTRSQAALAQGEESAARLALRETGDHLAELSESLGPSSADTVASMQDRLDLILSEIDRDAFAAQSDLSVLATSLAALERDLAQGP
jgi:hypothetical protein